MAFPYLLFLVMIGSTVSGGLADVTLGGALNKGVLQLVLLIGAFTWFYPARIVRTQVQSLRHAEFVEAAAMTGARDARIVRTHLLPHVVPPLVVFATLAVATNVMVEVGVTFLGAGVQPADRVLGLAARRDVGRPAAAEPVQPGLDAAVADRLPEPRDLPHRLLPQPARRGAARGARPARRPVIGYVLRRLAVAVCLLFVLSIVTFLMYAEIPSNPAGFVLDLQHATPEQIAEADHLLGVDRPLWVQYVKYVERAVRGDFGISWGAIDFSPTGEASGVHVGPMVWSAAKVTASLVVGGFVILLLIALPLGTFAATRPRGFVDRLTLGALARGDLDAPARRRAAAAALRRQPLAPGAVVRLLPSCPSPRAQGAPTAAGRPMGVAPGAAVGRRSRSSSSRSTCG